MTETRWPARWVDRHQWVPFLSGTDGLTGRERRRMGDRYRRQHQFDDRTRAAIEKYRNDPDALVTMVRRGADGTYERIGQCRRADLPTREGKQ